MVCVFIWGGEEDKCELGSAADVELNRLGALLTCFLSLSSGALSFLTLFHRTEIIKCLDKFRS